MAEIAKKDNYPAIITFFIKQMFANSNNII